MSHARAARALLVTCEHGGNRVPAEYRQLFVGWRQVLGSHRGYDPGALALARDLAGHFGAPLVASTTSRLLVELNRSPGHPAQFSERTRVLPADQKARLAALHYEPYRAEVNARIEAFIAAGCSVLHVSCHSFTPVLDGVQRAADVGLLYDPGREPERTLCQRWSKILGARIAPLRVRRNYPYRGYDDGLTTALRRRFPSDRYCGVEIEVNQMHVQGPVRQWRALRRQLVASLEVLHATDEAPGGAAAPHARGGVA